MYKYIGYTIICCPVLCAKVAERMNITYQYKCDEMMEYFWLHVETWFWFIHISMKILGKLSNSGQQTKNKYIITTVVEVLITAHYYFTLQPMASASGWSQEFKQYRKTDGWRRQETSITELLKNHSSFSPSSIFPSIEFFWKLRLLAEHLKLHEHTFQLILPLTRPISFLRSQYENFINIPLSFVV